MELKLEQEHIHCFDLVLDTCVCQEETQEAIVPDACPDIARIVDGGGQLCLSEKHVQDGALSVSGTVDAWVIYQPEGEGALCRMAAKIPFTARTEAAQLHPQGRCVLNPSLGRVEARMLNPRKILLRADMELGVQAFEPRELALCRGLTCDGEMGVEQRVVQHTAYLTTTVQEKEFSIYDEIRLNAGPGGRAQILSITAEPHCTESRVIGSKLIFKGETALQVRYLAAGELCSMRCTMPFSQIMEVEGAGETADCQIAMCATGVECTPVGDDERTLNVTLELLGQAVVRDHSTLTVLQDAYSTVHQLDVRQDSCCLCQLLDCSVRPQSVRELLETAQPVRSVIDASVRISNVKQSRQDGQQEVCADLCLQVLYLDEQGAAQALHSVVTVSGQLDVPTGSQCQCTVRCPGEVFAVPAAGGIEVRLNPEFHCLVTRQQTVPVVADAKPGAKHGECRQEQPSVVLRMAAPEEQLWDIAKAYCTTQEHIRQANHLEEDELPVGQMLLIPGVR